MGQNHMKYVEEGFDIGIRLIGLDSDWMGDDGSSTGVIYGPSVYNNRKAQPLHIDISYIWSYNVGNYNTMSYTILGSSPFL